MSGLSVSGIASGIDSDSIISQMVALETRSITTLQRRIALEEAERVTFEDISARLQALQTSTKAFSADSLFATLSATSSHSNLLTVSATDAAPRGIHKIKVLQTALAHRLGGTGVPDPIGTKLDTNFSVTDFGAGTFLNDPSLKNISDYEIDPAATSTFNYTDQVKLSGTYVGDTNVSMTIELLSDFGAGAGGAGTVDLRISYDGVTFQNYSGVAVDGSGNINLTSDPHFKDTGIDVTINAADATMKDGDVIMFRARAKASIEYTIADGSRKEIVIESDDTLSELVRAINDDSDLGLRGDILNDGSATNPYRLILTSLTDGSEGEITILSNTSIIDLQGLSVEPPVSDSITYTGTVSMTPADTDPARGLGNTTIVVEMIEDGALADVAFRISLDGGLTFHDNNGAGFALTAGGGGFEFDLFAELVDDNGDPVFDFDIGLNLDFTNDGSEFSVGDRITIDLFDSEIQAAQDALINVNGINLVKSSNIIDDVFDGLKLNLQDADADQTITVNITEKTGDITSAMNGFVEAYNSAMSLIHAQSKFNPEEDEEAPLLMGDATVRQIQTSLQRYVTGRISILGGDTISALADIGITTDSTNGQLIFNSAELSSALTDDPNAVRRLLSRFGDVIDGSNASFVSSTSATKAGTYRVEVTQRRERAEVVATNPAVTIGVGRDETLFISVDTDATGGGSIRNVSVSLTAGMTPAQQVIQIQKELDSRDIDVSVTREDGKITFRHNEYGADFEISVSSSLNPGDSGFSTVVKTDAGQELEGTINGLEAKVEGDVLVGKDGFAFEDLRVRVSNDFSGFAGEIRLNDGLGSSFSKLLDSFVGLEGVLSTRINSFNSTISRIESQIDRVSERASLLETRLRKQFVNLEVTLGRLNATGEYLTAQLKALPGVQINKNK